MPELRNLNAEWLSLVDRAAVRDPSDPSQPQRFLLWKKESGEPEPEPNLADLQTQNAKLAKAIKKMQKHIDGLTTTTENVPPAAHDAEEATTIMKDEAETQTPEELAKQLSSLSKADGGLSAAQARFREIGASYLQSLSPAAHAAWLRGQESIGGAPYPGAPLLKADTPPVDADGIKAKAEDLRKSDPTLSPYDAMLKALADDRAGQAAYLTEVRGC